MFCAYDWKPPVNTKLEFIFNFATGASVSIDISDGILLSRSRLFGCIPNAFSWLFGIIKLVFGFVKFSKFPLTSMGALMKMLSLP